VWVVLATDGRHSHHSSKVSAAELVELRAREFREACARLGLGDDDVVSWGFEDGTLGENLDELTARIRGLLDEHRPQEILIPSAIDGHGDHRALNAAAMRAAREGGFGGHVSAYPVWFWTIKAGLAGRRPTLINLVRSVFGCVRTIATIKTASVRTDSVLDDKRHAIEAYDSQLRSPVDEPGWATIPAHVLGRFTREKELYFPIEIGP
jgi:LmbE family N-acetylglucosaminyl deacetylase